MCEYDHISHYCCYYYRGIPEVIYIMMISIHWLTGRESTYCVKLLCSLVQRCLAGKYSVGSVSSVTYTVSA